MPPVTVDTTEPSLLFGQLAAEANKLTSKLEGSVSTNTHSATKQPIASETVTQYSPSASPLRLESLLEKPFGPVHE